MTTSEDAFEKKAREIVNEYLIRGETQRSLVELAADISSALREEREAEREACAKIADYWGAGKMIVQDEPGRSRYTRQDLQTYTNVAGRGIAEDIRARKTENSNV